MITYRLNGNHNIQQLKLLYDSVGWSAYTQHLSNLKQSVDHSLYTVSAHDGSQLVGLARVVGDGVSIIYIQDLLVHPNYQRLGIGKKLLERIFNRYDKVRQIILLTENNPDTINFYQSVGFVDVNSQNCVAFIKNKETL